jgi:uncharacterized protein (TIGR03067 family)
MRSSSAATCLLLLAAQFAPAAEPAPAAAPAQTDQALLQGTWSVESIEIGGRPIRNLRDMKYTFQSDVLVRDADKCKVVLDPAKTPKHIDLVYSDGTRELGTYAIEGERLSLWFNDQIDQRPGKIAPNARQIRLVRIKKADDK